MASKPPLSPRSKGLLGQATLGASDGGIRARIFLVAVIAIAGLIAYLGIRPHQPWILWFTTLMIALSTDGAVRTHPRFHGAGAFATLPFLVLPAMAVAGAGYFIHEALEGYFRPGAGFFAGLFVAAIVLGEYYTVDFESRLYGTMRLILAVATYLVAFAIYTIIYTEDFSLPVGATLVGLVSMGLSIALLRETRILPGSALLVGLAIGVTMAELRIVLYFFPLDGLLAGALLIIGFYMATGIVHHLLDHDLEFGTLMEYVLVGGVGTAAVVITRIVV